MTSISSPAPTSTASRCCRPPAAEKITPRELVERNVPRFPGHGEDVQRLERRLHPHHRAAPLRVVRRDLGEDAGGRRHLSRQICRLVFGARRGLLRRERDAPRRQGHAARSAGHAGRMGGGGELFLPPLRFRRPAAQALQRRARLRAAERAHERGGELRARRPEGSVDLAHDIRLGRAGARRSQARHVCVGRCADKLHHRRRLSRYGIGEIQEILAGQSACDRQGHCALPRGLLAGLPDVGRDRGAAPGVLPRLSLQPR